MGTEITKRGRRARLPAGEEDGEKTYRERRKEGDTRDGKTDQKWRSK